MDTRLRPFAWLAAAAAVGLALPSAAAPARPAATTARASASGQPAIFWSGQAWVPRVSVTPQPVWRNYWNPSPQSVYVDSAGHLHLWIRKTGSVWTAAEVTSVKRDYGYGTYTFVVETPIAAQDPNQYLGLYTRNELPDGNSSQGNKYVDHAETDFEFGNWCESRPHRHCNAQYAVQPYFERGHRIQTRLPAHTAYTTQFVWAPNSTTFRVWRGTRAHGKPVSSWTSHFSNGVPRIGTAAYLNTWLTRGRGPARKHNQEIVVDSFTYTPAP